MTQPNVIVFFTDQQRWDTCGCYGQRLPLTPNLDRMAQKGVRFEYAFTCQPVCGPVRSVLQTGIYATESGCFRNDIALDPEYNTLAKRMSSAGYEAGYIGKWHLASTGGTEGCWLPEGRERCNHKTDPVPPPLRGGYDDFWLASDVLEFTSHGEGGYMFNGDGEKVEFEGYRVERQTDFAIEYLQTRTRETPFFLFLSYLEPHHQNDRNRYEGPPGSKEKWAKYDVPGDLVDTEGDWRENMPDYLGCVNALDTALGRVMDELERLGIAENTVILFTSDHGSHFKTRNPEYKRSCHDGSLRIPMVAYGPGFTGGTVSQAMASLIDVPPTVLAAAGVEVPSSWRGRPLQEGAQEPSDWPGEIFAQISESCVGRTLRTHRWTYCVTAPDLNGGALPSAERYVESHLYDNEADPHQKNNLVTEAGLTDIREMLRARLLDYLERIEGGALIEPTAPGTT